MTLTDNQFAQVKHLLRAIWSQYGDEYGYRSEKIARVDAAGIDDAYALVQMLNASNRVTLWRLMLLLNMSWPADWDDLLLITKFAA